MSKTLEIQRMVESHIAEYLCKSEGWSFHWNKRTTALGLTHFRTRQIELSILFASVLPMEVMENTSLHEVAHALAGFHAGHDLEWQEYALLVGAKPERCANVEEYRHLLTPATMGYKYSAVCQTCNYQFHFSRMGKQWKTGRKACNQCCNKYNRGKWDERFILQIIRHY